MRRGEPGRWWSGAVRRSGSCTRRLGWKRSGLWRRGVWCRALGRGGSRRRLGSRREERDWADSQGAGPDAAEAQEEGEAAGPEGGEGGVALAYAPADGREVSQGHRGLLAADGGAGPSYIAPDFLGHRFGVEEGVQRRSEAC